MREPTIKCQLQQPTSTLFKEMLGFGKQNKKKQTKKTIALEDITSV